MTIFRHKESGHLYIIEHLVHDYKHLNRNSFSGIYAYPFMNNVESIKFINSNLEICKNFVINNFEPKYHR